MFMCDVMPRIGDDVVQRDQAMLYFPQRCTMLLEHMPHLWTCAHLKLRADVKQLAYNVATTWRKSCPTLSSDGTTLLSWATQHNVAQHYRVSSAPSTTLPHTTQTLPNVCQRCQTAAQRFSTLSQTKVTLSEHVSGGSLLLNLRTLGTSHRTPPWSQVS